MLCVFKYRLRLVTCTSRKIELEPLFYLNDDGDRARSGMEPNLQRDTAIEVYTAVERVILRCTLQPGVGNPAVGSLYLL